MDVGALRMQVRLIETSRVLGEHGYSFTSAHIETAYRRCQAALNDLRKREGDVTFDEQVERFLEEIMPSLPLRLPGLARDRIASRYADSYLEHPARVDEHAHRVLEGVQARGYRVALICNTGSTPGKTQRVFMEQAGLARLFDTLTFSDEERLSKPSVEIFHLTLRRVGGVPHQAIHVGDHPRNDVLGAKRAGLKAIWLKRKDDRPEVAPDAQIDSLDQMLEALDRLSA
jgi:putative hydrolase of the HAD superfamily